MQIYEMNFLLFLSILMALKSSRIVRNWAKMKKNLDKFAFKSFQSLTNKKQKTKLINQINDLLFTIAVHFNNNRSHFHIHNDYGLGHVKFTRNWLEAFQDNIQPAPPVISMTSSPGITMHSGTVISGYVVQIVRHFINFIL